MRAISSTEFSPQSYTRIGGLLYLLIIAAGLFAEAFVRVAQGSLTFASGFLPKAFGVLMAIAGVCYLTNSAAVLLSPRLAALLFRQSSCRHSSVSYRLQCG